MCATWRATTDGTRVHGARQTGSPSWPTCRCSTTSSPTTPGSPLTREYPLRPRRSETAPGNDNTHLFISRVRLFYWGQYCVLHLSFLKNSFSLSENCNWWLHEMFLLVVPPIYNHCPSQKANWEITGNRSPPTGLELNLATEKQITFHLQTRRSSQPAERQTEPLCLCLPAHPEGESLQTRVSRWVSHKEHQFQKTEKLPLLPLKCVSLLILILNFDTFQKILAVKLNRVLVRN